LKLAFAFITTAIDFVILAINFGWLALQNIMFSNDGVQAIASKPYRDYQHEK